MDSNATKFPPEDPATSADAGTGIDGVRSRRRSDSMSLASSPSPPPPPPPPPPSMSSSSVSSSGRGETRRGEPLLHRGSSRFDDNVASSRIASQDKRMREHHTDEGGRQATATMQHEHFDSRIAKSSPAVPILNTESPLTPHAFGLGKSPRPRYQNPSHEAADFDNERHPPLAAERPIHLKQPPPPPPPLNGNEEASNSDDADAERDADAVAGDAVGEVKKKRRRRGTACRLVLSSVQHDCLLSYLFMVSLDPLLVCIRFLK